MIVVTMWRLRVWEVIGHVFVAVTLEPVRDQVVSSEFLRGYLSDRRHEQERLRVIATPLRADRWNGLEAELLLAAAIEHTGFLCSSTWNTP